MTWPEIEAVRAFNIAFKEAGLGNALFHKAMHFGAANYMKMRVPRPDEPRIRVPEWAREPIADTAREMVANLKASGVRVSGDLDALLPPEVPDPMTDESRVAEGGDRCISPEVAAAMAVGMAVISGKARGARPSIDAAADLGRYPTYQLAGTLLGRLRRLFGGPPVPVGERAAVEPSLSPVLVAAQQAIFQRLEDEGLGLPAAAGLRARAMRLAGDLIPPAGATAPAAPGCVPPEAAAAYALAMLEAAGVVRSAGDAARPRRLVATRWWWLEPPDLARISTFRVSQALAARVVPRRRGGSARPG
jgi:hypothetical protein